MTKKVDKSQLRSLRDSGWSYLSNRIAISKTYDFQSFNEAFTFMTGVSLYAEKLNHHPEWSNVYSRVDIVLTTHDLGAISELDIKLAEKMDKLANKLL